MDGSRLKTKACDDWVSQDFNEVMFWREREKRLYNLVALHCEEGVTTVHTISGSERFVLYDEDRQFFQFMKTYQELALY